MMQLLLILSSWLCQCSWRDPCLSFVVILNRKLTMPKLLRMPNERALLSKQESFYFPQGLGNQRGLVGTCAWLLQCLMMASNSLFIMLELITKVVRKKGELQPYPSMLCGNTWRQYCVEICHNDILVEGSS